MNDKRYHWVQFLPEAYFRNREWPRHSKTQGEKEGGELWRGGQEEYKWDWREGKVLGGCDAADAECRSAREWKWVYVGATVELRAAEGERQRGVEICWEEADVRSTRSTRCNPKHRGHEKLIEREREILKEGRTVQKKTISAIISKYKKLNIHVQMCACSGC